MSLSRRQLLTGLAAVAAAPRLLFADAKGHRPLDIRVNADGFGDASADDIKVVVTSAGEAIWKHCPNSEFRVGFHIFHRKDSPITLNDHSEDGRIRVGLAAEDTYWSQFAYQFGHEFCHALAGHCNDWKPCWLDGHANKWLEETLCEAASLFAPCAMGESWKTDPPYSTWKSYAPKLTDYAQKRIEDPQHALPDGKTFAEWFKQEERSLRKDASQRAKNTLIARQLLPLFETTPAGWEALTFLNRVERDAKKELSQQMSDWKAAAPDHAKFLVRLAAVFGVAS